jgi:hypothetical protein
MDTKTLKEIFLAELQKEVVDKLTPPFLALIDETIESVINGSTTMDGKRATTETEAINFIRHGVLARTNVFHKMVLAAKTIDYDNVTINYRGTTLKVK